MRVRRADFWSLFWSRMLVVAVLVLATYNVTGFSYYHWIASGFEGFQSPLGALQILAGVVISVWFLILFRATWRAKGPIGIFLTFLVLSVLTYFIWTFGIIDLHNSIVSILIAQIFLTVILALGTLWSSIWVYYTGQRSVEDPDS